MRRLVIAIDCDDVLVPSTEKLVEMYNKAHGTNVQLSGAHTSGNPDWGAPREVVRERLHDIQLMEKCAQTRPFDDAIEVCHRLAREHELHLVTARSEVIMHTTIAMLNSYFPGVFVEIEHVGIDGSKGEMCRQLRADVLIDDSLKHLVSAQECGLKHLIWFGDYPWQSHDISSKDASVRRATGWNDVEKMIEQIANRLTGEPEER